MTGTSPSLTHEVHALVHIGNMRIDMQVYKYMYIPVSTKTLKWKTVIQMKIEINYNKH